MLYVTIQLGLEDDELQGRSAPNASPSKSRGKSKTVGVLEKKANTTIIGGEVVISRDGRGDVKVGLTAPKWNAYTNGITWTFSSIC